MPSLATLEYGYSTEMDISIQTHKLASDDRGDISEDFSFRTPAPVTAWKLKFRVCNSCKGHKKRYLYCTIVATDLSSLPGKKVIGQFSLFLPSHPNHLVEICHVWRENNKRNGFYMMEMEDLTTPTLKMHFRLRFQEFDMNDLLPNKNACSRQFKELSSCHGCRTFVSSQITTLFKETEKRKYKIGSAMFSPCFGIPDDEILFCMILYPRGTILTPEIVTGAIQVVHLPEYVIKDKGIEIDCSMKMPNGAEKYETTVLQEGNNVGWAFTKLNIPDDCEDIPVTMRVNFKMPTKYSKRAVLKESKAQEDYETTLENQNNRTKELLSKMKNHLQERKNLENDFQKMQARGILFDQTIEKIAELERSGNDVEEADLENIQDVLDSKYVDAFELPKDTLSNRLTKSLHDNDEHSKKSISSSKKPSV